MRNFLSALLPAYKSGIALKLAIVLSAFGILASGLTGYYSYYATRDVLVEGAGKDLLLSTQVLGRRFSIAAGEIATDARYMARLPDTHNIFSARHEQVLSELKHDLASQLTTLLSVHPEYFQARLISADHNGIELVRVDRDGPNLRQVEGPDLQEKAHFPYVFETLRLAEGQVHYSKIFINHETGAHAGLDKPTLQVATPVVDKSGAALGVIVINVDLNRLFDLLKTDLSGDFQLFLANREGDYLIHPDPAKAFGFEQGRRFLMQDDFSQVAAIVADKSDTAIIGAGQNNLHGDIMGSFARIPFGEFPGRLFVILGLTVPLDQVLQGTDTVGRNALRIVIVFSILAILLSILVARAFVRPLRQLVAAVERFSRSRELLPLPTARNDELGLLARSFSQMQQHILSHLDEINQRKQSMEHQATHDALTGAPNRALLHDLLQFSISNARRGETRLALLFVDLDHFKAVNDTYGHATGDAVLIEAVDRLKRAVRDNDVVARLSGDEFVVLIQPVDDDGQVGVVAQKLIESLHEPIRFKEIALQISASIGISIFPRDGDSSEELLVNADAAMYRAKRDGRNTFKYFSADSGKLETQP